MKLNPQEIADLKVYLDQAPFKLFSKVIENWRQDILDQLPTADPEDLRYLQGVLGGIKGCSNVLRFAAHELYNEPEKNERKKLINKLL